jgi:extradiol dioxygenase family protein
MTRPSPPFHLAFPVTDLAATREFFAGILGCKVGRESERWIDFDFFGHQIIGPRVRFPDQAGEQATFFIRDPSGNALEFKSFRDPDLLFARDNT